MNNVIVLDDYKSIFEKRDRVMQERYNRERYNIERNRERDSERTRRNRRAVRIQDNNIKEYILKIMLLGISVLILSFVISFLFLSKSAKAVDLNDVTYKYYHVITIEKGDTLWKLADESGFGNNPKAFVNEVTRMNNLCDESLVEGSWIVVPYYSNEIK